MSGEPDKKKTEDSSVQSGDNGGPTDTPSKPKRKRARKKSTKNPPLELAQHDLQTKLKETTEKLSQRDREVRKLEREYQKLEDAKVKAEASLSERIEAQKAEVKQLRGEIGTHQRAEALKERQTQEQLASLKRLQNDHDELQQEHDAAVEAFQQRVGDYEGAERRMGEVIARKQAELEQQYQQRIDALQAELETSTDHEKELAAQVKAMIAQRDQATEALTEARQQIEEHRHAFKAIGTRIEQDQQERNELQRQLDQLREAFSSSAVSLTDALDNEDNVPTEYVAESPGSQSMIVGAAAAVLLVLVAIGLGLFTYLQPVGIERSIVGYLHVSQADESTLDEYRDKLIDVPTDSSIAGLDVVSLPQQGMLRLTVDIPEGGDPKSLRDTVDVLGQGIASQHNAEVFAQWSTDLDHTADRIGEIRTEMGSLRATVSTERKQAVTEAVKAIERFESMLTSRRKLEDQLTEADRRMATLQNLTALAEVDAERLAEAEREDQVLQADRAELARREAELRATLVDTINTADDAFGTVKQRVDESVAFIDERKKRGYGDEVNKKIDAMKAGISDWRDAAETLKDAWDIEREALSSQDDPADPIEARTQLEEAVRRFNKTVQKGMDDYRRALDELDQSGDQVATYVVLKRDIENEIDETIRAVDMLIATARSIMLEYNPSLSAVVPGLAGMRDRVEQRRQAIADGLQQEALRDKEQQRVAEFDKAEAKAAEIRDQIAALDQQLAASSIDLDALQAIVTETSGAESEQALRRQLKSLNIIGETLHNMAQNARSTAPTATWIPASEVASAAEPNRLNRAVMIGSIPLAGALAMAGIIGGLQLYRRNEESMREIDDALRADREDG